MVHPQQHVKYVQKSNYSLTAPCTLYSWCVHFNRLEGKSKLWKDPFMKLNYLCCMALKLGVRLLIQRDFNSCL